MAQIGMAEKVFSELKLIAEQFQKDNPNATAEQIRKHVANTITLDTDLLDTMNRLHIAVDNFDTTTKKGKRAVRLGNSARTSTRIRQRSIVPSSR